MKKYFKYLGIVLGIVIILSLLFLSRRPEKEEMLAQQDDYVTQEGVNIDKNEVTYQENLTVGDLKNEVGASGDNEIYDITTEYDGRKILTIKSEVQFDVVLAGLLDGKKPELDLKKLEEKASVFQGKKGVWIEENSREEFLKLLKETTRGSYNIDTERYLVCEQDQSGNDIDKRLKQILLGDDLLIIAVTGNCYTADEISGKIVEYPFEKMDPYQTSETFVKNNQKICVLSTNEKGKLTSEEIVKSVL